MHMDSTNTSFLLLPVGRTGPLNVLVVLCLNYVFPVEAGPCAQLMPLGGSQFLRPACVFVFRVSGKPEAAQENQTTRSPLAVRPSKVFNGRGGRNLKGSHCWQMLCCPSPGVLRIARPRGQFLISGISDLRQTAWLRLYGPF